MVLPALAASPALAQTMEVSSNGARASVAGPAETFTGVVTVTPLFAANEFSNASGQLVQFTPGARSAWHTHPAGQTLIVTEGMGWVQQEGGEKIEIRPGDVIRTPPGVKHWHGATAAVQSVTLPSRQSLTAPPSRGSKKSLTSNMPISTR